MEGSQSENILKRQLMELCVLDYVWFWENTLEWVFEYTFLESGFEKDAHI